MGRYIAKNIVAAGLARSAEVQLAYAIGVANPVSVTVSTENTALLPEDDIAELIREHFPLTPRGIIKYLNLQRPIYKQTARHGHFGRTPGTDGALAGRRPTKQRRWPARRESSRRGDRRGLHQSQTTLRANFCLSRKSGHSYLSASIGSSEAFHAG